MHKEHVRAKSKGESVVALISMSLIGATQLASSVRKGVESEEVP